MPSSYNLPIDLSLADGDLLVLALTFTASDIRGSAAGSQPSPKIGRALLRAEQMTVLRQRIERACESVRSQQRLADG